MSANEQQPRWGASFAGTSAGEAVLQGRDRVAPPLPARGFRGNAELVLLVDDEEPVRLLLKGLLETFNFQVIPAADGTEALASFAAHRERIKLVITDEWMPHMGGSTLIRTLRHMAPELRMIAMSGLPDEQRATELATQGVARFLHKPFTIDQLVEALREAFAAEAAESELPRWH